ncbi:hypothetical protein ACJZ2D_006028 [Fusarium nematophilum]
MIPSPISTPQQVLVKPFHHGRSRPPSWHAEATAFRKTNHHSIIWGLCACLEASLGSTQIKGRSAVAPRYPKCWGPSPTCSPTPEVRLRDASRRASSRLLDYHMSGWLHDCRHADMAAYQADLMMPCGQASHRPVKLVSAQVEGKCLLTDNTKKKHQHPHQLAAYLDLDRDDDKSRQPFRSSPEAPKDNYTKDMATPPGPLDSITNSKTLAAMKASHTVKSSRDPKTRSGQGSIQCLFNNLIYRCVRSFHALFLSTSIS